MTRERLLYLGKKLEKRLEKNSGDETSAWMAHYVVEKMVAISSARGKAKASAQRECFEVILTLWHFQACFPRDIRPFKDFDPVFRAMAHIDPNKESPSYFFHKNDSDTPPNETEKYANILVNLDASTRTMMSYFLRKAVLSATDEDVLAWLHGVESIASTSEVKVILNVVSELDATEESNEKTETENRIKELSEKIDRLQAFQRTSELVRLSMESEMKELKNEIQK